MFSTPILLVVFNRPEYTKKVFEQIRMIRPTTLFIAADGPRPDRADDEEKCAEVRRIVSNIDWPCEVHKLFREKNIGFRDCVRLAFDWFFENVEAGIILEDDGLPHPSFFRFASEMLEKYRDNDKVMMITGNNFLPDIKMDTSYFFSRYYSIWGWASWRRAWKKYDFEMKSWAQKENKDKVKAFYSQKYMQDRTKKMFDEIYPGPPKTWDTQWLYACLINDGFCITPSVNIVSNIGLDGVHSEGHNQNIPTRDLYGTEFRNPNTIEECAEYDNTFYTRNLQPPPFSLKREILKILFQSAVWKKILRPIYHFALPKRAT